MKTLYLSLCFTLLTCMEYLVSSTALHKHTSHSIFRGIFKSGAFNKSRRPFLVLDQYKTLIRIFYGIDLPNLTQFRHFIILNPRAKRGSSDYPFKSLWSKYWTYYRTHDIPHSGRTGNHVTVEASIKMFVYDERYLHLKLNEPCHDNDIM